MIDIATIRALKQQLTYASVKPQKDGAYWVWIHPYSYPSLLWFCGRHIRAIRLWVKLTVRDDLDFDACMRFRPWTY